MTTVQASEINREIVAKFEAKKETGFYRPSEPRTSKIGGNWEHFELLAFGQLCQSKTELLDSLPDRVFAMLGDIDPTNEAFRRTATGFQKVSQVWLQLGRAIGIKDFSIEQALFVLVAVFLEEENARVKVTFKTPQNPDICYLEFYCLGNPQYHGAIGWEGYRLYFPENVFDKVIRRRLTQFEEHCPHLSQILVIPGADAVDDASVVDIAPDNVIEPNTPITGLDSEDEDEDELDDEF